MKPIHGGLDPLEWAKKPRSRDAFAALLGLVKKADPRFVVIFNALQREGITDGVKLLMCWDGQKWIAA